MPSILSNNKSNENQKDPFDNVKSLADKILSTSNPQETFMNLVNSNPTLKNGYDMMYQYGNGNPRTAFMNVMNEKGKQSLGSQIIQCLQRFGIG